MLRRMDEAKTLCEHCGYDLRGHEGDWRKCPECGECNDLAAREPKRPVPRVWGYLAFGAAAAILIPLFIFRISLRVNGFRLIDLWGGGDARLAGIRARSSGLTSVPPDVPKFASVGIVLSQVCFWLAMVGCLYSLCLFVTAILRRDKKAILFASAGTILSVVAGIMSMQIGFVIAGI